MRLPWCLAWAGLLVACTSGPEGPPRPSPSAPATPAGRTAAGASQGQATSLPAGAGEPFACEGPLVSTKGNPAVCGALLDRAAVRAALGEGWERDAIGKPVRVRGRRRVHRCGPHEQCLLGGEIPLIDADLIEPAGGP